MARAPALQAGGHRFDSDILHHPNSRRLFKDNSPAEDCEAVGSREGEVEKVLSNKTDVIRILHSIKEEGWRIDRFETGTSAND